MSRPSTRTSTVLSGDKVFGPTGVVLVVPTNLQAHKTCNVTDVSQRAALAAVSGDLAAVAEMRPAFDRRRLVMHSMLNEIDRVT
jgi:aspartate/methionine/tyrosine aminotransferase